MDSFRITGGTPLHGTIQISGSKNSSLPIMAAALMAEDTVTLTGVPRLQDIETMSKLLAELGCHVFRRDAVRPKGPFGFSEKHPSLDGELVITVVDEKSFEARYDIVKTFRAGICVMGPLLATRGKAVVGLPGGCAIGDRPADLHVRGLEKLGAKFRTENGNMIGEVKGRLKGTKMFLGGPQGPTVLGTINVMSAAALAEGETVIVGAACEPEVCDCAQMLNAMGAKIVGYGTPEIRIEGVEKLRGIKHQVIPDRIEAGTFMLAAAITGGSVRLVNVNLDHLTAVLDRFTEAGVSIEYREAGVMVSRGDAIRSINVVTQPYPGFPTDLQAQLMALLTLAEGDSIITERIFPDRFIHVGELNRMGASIRKEGASAAVHGVKQLSGAPVMCSDLRASAALVLAALAAQGTSRIDRIYHIDRGYEKIEQKLQAVGAQIERIGERQPPIIAA